MNQRVRKIIAEALGSPDIATSAGILKFEDNPLTEAIVDFFEERKDCELVRVQENGDIWLIDVRTTLADVSTHQQYAREEGKEKAYNIKREFDQYIIDRFNIPSASISGVRMNGSNVCEFEIQFVYANKGNIKVHYESVQVKKKVIKEATSIDNFLDAVRTVDASVQLSDLSVEATQKGNWCVYDKGKKLTIVRGNLLDDDTIRNYDLEYHSENIDEVAFTEDISTPPKFFINRLKVKPWSLSDLEVISPPDSMAGVDEYLYSLPKINFPKNYTNPSMALPGYNGTPQYFIGVKGDELYFVNSEGYNYPRYILRLR